MIIAQLPWHIEETILGVELRNMQDQHIATFSNRDDAEFVLRSLEIHIRNAKKQQ